MCRRMLQSDQTLTRVSISRNSRREITVGFPSRAGEVNFRVSFSSRFSRFLENISLSPLVSQDLYIQILFLLSVFKILHNHFSFSSRFSRFKKNPPEEKFIGWKMKSSSSDQWVWVVVWGLETSKITLLASSWLPSSQARVTSANAEWLGLSYCLLSSFQMRFYQHLVNLHLQNLLRLCYPEEACKFSVEKTCKKYCEKNDSLEYL